MEANTSPLQCVQNPATEGTPISYKRGIILPIHHRKLDPNSKRVLASAVQKPLPLLALSLSCASSLRNRRRVRAALAAISLPLLLPIPTMAGIRLTPEEPELPQGTPPRPQLPPAFAGAGAVLAGSGSGGGGGLEMASDDERSVAADSWSVRSEYGSTLDDDQRYADAAEVLAAAAASANFPSGASDCWYFGSWPYLTRVELSVWDCEL